MLATLQLFSLLTGSFALLTFSVELSTRKERWRRFPQDERRAFLKKLLTISSSVQGPAVVILSPLPGVADDLIARVSSSLANPSPKGITTVVLQDPKSSRIGVELFDVSIDKTLYPAVKSVQTGGLAAAEGVQEGMILLGGKSTSADIVRRLKGGPYPVVLQFLDLAAAAATVTDGAVTLSSNRILESVLEKEKASRKAPPLSPKGAGLIVKTLQPASSSSPSTSCARRGDRVTVRYEARVASQGGPLYDSTDQRGVPAVAFRLGKKEAINGVDIGLNGMCVGEVRTLDIPASLGYGQFGSTVFDIPGDVRLWWKVELVDLEKGP